jgi:hypothetical protein
MDTHLIYQLNQAVDRGDKRVKRDMLAKADQVKRFIETLSQEDPRLIKLLRLVPPAFKEAQWIAYLVHVLGFYPPKIKGGNKPPRWVLAWYQKARAWHTAGVYGAVISTRKSFSCFTGSGVKAKPPLWGGWLLFV